MTQPSSPEALERLKTLVREYFRTDDMTASRTEIIKATYAAYPVTDQEIEQLHSWGWHRFCDHESAHRPCEDRMNGVHRSGPIDGGHR